MYVPDARLSWRQDLDIQGGASRQLTVAGQEYRDVVFDRRSKVYCVWRFETVPDSNLGGLFDHRRANFRQNQSTLGEKSVVLCEEGLVTLSQWLNTAFHPRQTRGQDLSSGACAQAAQLCRERYRRGPQHRRCGAVEYFLAPASVMILLDGACRLSRDLDRVSDRPLGDPGSG